MQEKKINIAVVGIGWFGTGGRLAEVYNEHPDVANVTLCEMREDLLAKKSEELGIKRTASTLEAVLENPEIDAVHLSTGIPDHARHSIQVLEAGKHCACAVPMATTLNDLRAIIAAVRKSGKNYMMAETGLYTKAYLHVQELMRQGMFGRIQLLRGAHYQDMESWPAYWAGMPPMWYTTHAVAPLTALSGRRPEKVRCLGSGYLRAELQQKYGNPFPIETALFSFEGKSPLAMEITRALFHSARGYSEAFSIYGEDAAFEWQQLEQDNPVLFRLSSLGDSAGPRRGDYPGSQRVAVERPEFKAALELLPAELAQFADRGHGAWPHVVHEFVRSVVEGRKPAMDELTSADWTAPGICAHESALKGGAEVVIPRFE
ncbi:Gfo/Idh/MocA family protein [Bradyrhizobium sp. USDA 4529]